MIARSSLPTSRTSCVAPKRFGKFGAAIARSLRPLGWLGEGLISGVAAATQRRYLKPPDSAPSAGHQPMVLIVRVECAAT